MHGYKIVYNVIGISGNQPRLELSVAIDERMSTTLALGSICVAFSSRLDGAGGVRYLESQTGHILYPVCSAARGKIVCPAFWHLEQSVFPTFFVAAVLLAMFLLSRLD